MVVNVQDKTLAPYLDYAYSSARIGYLTTVDGVSYIEGSQAAWIFIYI